MKFFSAFSGIGGFDEGIKRAMPDAQCIGHSEINKYAVKIYEQHNPNNINYGDISKIEPRNLPDFDMLCGGFPCQDLSIAGKREGLCGARSGLFYEIIRIIQEKKPRLVFLENVKGLFSSDKGRDFARILIEMDESGYDVEWQCLNSKNFGVPQNRERVFIIGHLRGKPWKPVFPIRSESNEVQETSNGKHLCAGTLSTRNQSGQAQWDGSTTLIANAIDAIYFKGMDNHGQRTMIQLSGYNQSDRVYSTEGLSKCLSNGGGVGAKTGLIVHNMQPRLSTRPSAKNGGSGHITRNDGITYCLDSTPQAIEDQRIEKQTGIRRLTPLECERLQGYPDNWTSIGSDNIPISDSQRYKCLGNAVTVNVIEAIMNQICKTNLKLL